MTQPLLLLSTCGTSILTNGADPDTRAWLNRIANLPTLSAEENQRLTAHAAVCRDKLLAADPAGQRRLSAELNGIAAVLGRWQSARIQHLLLHTDTAVGKEAATLVESALAAHGQPVQMLSADGLQTHDFLCFRDALASLTSQIEDWVVGYRQQSHQVVFNLTGGFKSVNAYLQALGMLYADRCVFLFEGAGALMEIPRLPIRLAEAEEVREHDKVFRRLAAGYPVSEAEAAGVPESLLLVMDGQAELSIWGTVVWNRLRKSLFADVPLKEPLSDRLHVKDAVKRSFADLSKDQRVEVNEALDALCAHLDLKRPLMKSNTFKPLEGNPRPPSTHEIYASSHGGTLRVFGHFEGECFVADWLGPSLST